MRLPWLLVAGALFAWGNVAYLVYRYMQRAPLVSPYACPPGAAPVHPLLAPCFYGALVFSAALGVSLLALRKGRRPEFRDI